MRRQSRIAWQPLIETGDIPGRQGAVQVRMEMSSPTTMIHEGNRRFSTEGTRSGALACKRTVIAKWRVPWFTGSTAVVRFSFAARSPVGRERISSGCRQEHSESVRAVPSRTVHVGEWAWSRVGPTAHAD